MSDGNLTHFQMKALRDHIRQSSQEKYLEQSRKRLDRIVTSKLRTTFIGAIAAFEEDFGFLWGCGKPQDQLTDSEKEFAQLWQNTRTKVLNKSNNQLRAVRTELANHIVSWNRYRLDLLVKPIEETENDGQK